MLAPIKANNSPLRLIPAPKPRLLIVSDSPENLKSLKAGISEADFEISSVCSIEDLGSACREYHDLAVVDVEATKLKPMLSTLRSSTGHKAIMLLVESSRVTNDPNLAGVLPAFRAMPCNHTQIQTLVRLFSQGDKKSSAEKPMLL